MRNLLVDLENEPLSALLHFAGFILAITGLIYLIVLAAYKGTPWHIVAFSIFGGSLVLLYAASTLYHFTPITSKAREVFKRIDHSMIYVLIAGTYTPICILALKGVWGWSLLAIVWAIATTGIIMKSSGVRIYEWLSTTIYLVMGWLAVIAFFPLKYSLPANALIWLIIGGVSYSVGTIFFSLSHIKFHKKWFGMHEIWHMFVMFGSFSHFWLVFHYLI